MTENKEYWWPVALASDVNGNIPHAIIFNQKPLVAFRSLDNQVHTLNDFCPHRFAPLSRGKIVDGEVQCPYHGWQFNGAGVCTRVPGLNIELDKSPLIQTYAVQENSGLIWISESDDAQPISLAKALNETLDVFFIQDTVQCDLIDLLENFLDGFHTHFVHAGWIRKDKQRQTVQARVSPLPDGLEVEYSGETLQNGFVSRWLESDRGVSYGRFRLPNIAELEYRDKKNQLSLLVTLWATPIAEHHHKVFVRTATPKRVAPAKIKEFLLRKVFNKILQQDKEILELSHLRKRETINLIHSMQKQMHTKNDLLINLIRQLISSKSSNNFAPQTYQVHL
ncbi:MAG: aromatic ring-hydroxylating dioxygenase subunit alpha [Gammaproteobacteria bacterium]|nr:MAG: aromatic ring-hydroxylating dioxygenase subunit alpha [Gammaproteobacteria bacterium]